MEDEITGDQDSITGRDGYIMTQALAYAIAFIDSLPNPKQELSNRSDMLRLLEHFMPDPNERARHAADIEKRIKIRVDLADR